jgi:hypothetical protein
MTVVNKVCLFLVKYFESGLILCIYPHFRLTEYLKCNFIEVFCVEIYDRHSERHLAMRLCGNEKNLLTFSMRLHDATFQMTCAHDCIVSDRSLIFGNRRIVYFQNGW